jgi:hypothetical protein
MAEAEAVRITGGCLCGRVRFHATAAPIVTRTCWCRLCQALGAGSATVNACFPTEAVTIEGELTAYENTADSGNAMVRRFCPHCGTPMFSEAKARPHLIFIRAGALDDPELARPAMTIWTREAPSWACFDPSLPTLEAQPPPAG